MNQSRNLYTPAIGGYSTESDMMPLFEELVDTFVAIEKQQYCVVDGKEYEVFIKVLVVRHDVPSEVHRSWWRMCFHDTLLYVLQLHQ
jgi:hypothetical protein